MVSRERCRVALANHIHHTLCLAGLALCLLAGPKAVQQVSQTARRLGRETWVAGKSCTHAGDSGRRCGIVAMWARLSKAPAGWRYTLKPTPTCGREEETRHVHAHNLDSAAPTRRALPSSPTPCTLYAPTPTSAHRGHKVDEVAVGHGLGVCGGEVTLDLVLVLHLQAAGNTGKKQAQRVG